MGLEDSMAVDEFNGVGKKEMNVFICIYIEKRKKV